MAQSLVTTVMSELSGRDARARTSSNVVEPLPTRIVSWSDTSPAASEAMARFSRTWPRERSFVLVNA